MDSGIKTRGRKGKLMGRVAALAIAAAVLLGSSRAANAGTHFSFSVGIPFPGVVIGAPPPVAYGPPPAPYGYYLPYGPPPVVYAPSYYAPYYYPQGGVWVGYGNGWGHGHGHGWGGYGHGGHHGGWHGHH